MVCGDELKCLGRTDTQSCYSHSDCAAGFYCDDSTDYPYLSTCKKLKTSYE